MLGFFVLISPLVKNRNMMRLLILLFSVPFIVQGQSSIKRTSSEINQKYFKEHPEAKKEREWLNKKS